MKVVLLAPKPPPAGGIASWTVKMQNAKLKNGWNVDVVDEQLIGKRQNFGNTKKNLIDETKRSLIIWSNLWRFLKDKDVKVVHSNIPASTTAMLREYVCAIITKFRKRKFIIHYHCTLPNMVSSRIGVIVFRFLTNISDSAIVLNGPSVEFVTKHSKRPVALIPNFIEKNAVKNENTKVISPNINKIVYVGGVVKTKGCCEIIDVARKFPDIQFYMIGNPEQALVEIDKPSNIILCGEKTRREVDQELEEADVFMFVTYFPGEGFSVALLEAMAKGLPCIVSDWAANRDMIGEYGGIVVPPKDIEAMETAIKELEHDPVRREEQSNWNIRKVRDKYVDNLVTDLYVDSWEKVLM